MAAGGVARKICWTPIWPSTCRRNKGKFQALKIILKKSHQRPGRFLHPWIYRSELKSLQDAPKPGSLVEVFSHEGRFVGKGYFNLSSQITVRLLTRQPETIDKNFFKIRLEKALAFRNRFVKDTKAMRIISSEADELPGLIVDRYGDVLVMQCLTLGMDELKPLVLEALREVIPSKGIYERSDSSSRRLEGLKENTGWIEQDGPSEVVIFEKNVRYTMRLGEGQKTGFYLDQRENRICLSELGVRGQALDAFCYSGGFGLHLAKGGCRVLGIDSQKEVIAQAEENRALNGIDKEMLSFKVANVFDELKILEKEKRKFDLVILDPPSFVKKKEALEGALAGYKEILLRSMKLLQEGGLLAVFSCSYHVDDNLLMRTSMSAACDARKNLKLIKFLKQSLDHPINPFIPETYYLKGFLFSAFSLH